MNLNKPGMKMMIAGAMALFLSALALGAQMVLQWNYRSQNERALTALGRELSGDNEAARKRRKKIQTAGQFTFVVGMLVMTVGGILTYAKKNEVTVPGPGPR
ncbi:MAG TPA: hypothetical protein VIH35_06625 [Kiritimatiellia bacterium]